MRRSRRPARTAIADKPSLASFTEASGYSRTREVLQVEPRPTAIFAATNFIAFGALRALREAGLGIPDNMSIVAFDDLPPGWVMDPFLTVVSQPAYEIGTQAAGLLFERLAGEAPEGSRSIVLPSELVIRRSTAPPRRDRLPASCTLRELRTEHMLPKRWSAWG